MGLNYKALLIDDSKPVSFFNKIILERSNFFSKISISENGHAAIDLLNTGFSPDIIFLDLNMPVMNGWQFLEEYTRTIKKLSPIVLLLGAELSDADKAKLAHYTIIRDVKAKMLSTDILIEIKNNILEA